MAENDPEELTEREVEHEAAAARRDPVTAREALETELMDEDASPVGERVGDHIE